MFVVVPPPYTKLFVGIVVTRPTDGLLCCRGFLCFYHICKCLHLWFSRQWFGLQSLSKDSVGWLMDMGTFNVSVQMLVLVLKKHNGSVKWLLPHAWLALAFLDSLIVVYIVFFLTSHCLYVLRSAGFQILGSPPMRRRRLNICISTRD